MDAEKIAAIRALVAEYQHYEGEYTSTTWADFEKHQSAETLYYDRGVMLADEVPALLTALDEANAAREAAEHQRDVAYNEFSNIYDAIAEFGSMTVEHGVIPQGTLDEFLAEFAPYRPLLEAAKAPLATDADADTVPPEAPKEAT